MGITVRYYVCVRSILPCSRPSPTSLNRSGDTCGEGVGEFLAGGHKVCWCEVVMLRQMQEVQKSLLYQA
jgi:hypothetical protein